MKTTGAATLFGALAGLLLWMLLDMSVPEPGVSAAGGAFLIIVCTLLVAAAEVLVRKYRERRERR